MKNAISQYPLVSFFVMTFAFSWIAVLPLIINNTLPIEPFQILGALVGPTIAAVIAATTGRAGLGIFSNITFNGAQVWSGGCLCCSAVSSR